MNTYEILPTDENLLDTYQNDYISRNKDVYYFIELLNSIDRCYSICLDGAWGSGKTFFVKQTKMVLDAYNDFIVNKNEENKELIKSVFKSTQNGNYSLNPQVCVYYDAWENDNDKDPILSLIYSILQSVNSDFSFKKGKSFIQLTANIFDFFTEKDWSKLVEGFKSDDPFEELKAQKDIKNTIDEFLTSLIEEKGDRLIVFIDELDRCNPAFAVKLLERIKHYFSNDKISFVFSINIKELQHTIKTLYGNNFDACRYLDRFFDLTITLPPANIKQYYDKLKFKSNNYTYDIVCNAVINYFKFELREISRYVNMTRFAAYEPTHDGGRNWNFNFTDGRGEFFGIVYIVPIVIGLKIADINAYYDFIHGNDYSPMKNILGNMEQKYFEQLLSSNETYDEQDTDNTIVNVDSKLKAVYEAIFVCKYDYKKSKTMFGNLEFNKNTKENIMETASLLSNYSNYNY